MNATTAVLLLALPTLPPLPPLAAQCGIVADVIPGPAAPGGPARLTPAFGNELWFWYSEPNSGKELWKWSEQGGVQIVADLVPGSGSSDPTYLTPCCTASGPRMFYTATESGHGFEIYVSDGTAAGTGRLAEIQPGSVGSLPYEFCASGGKVYFNAKNTTFGEELWVADGTPAGTIRLSDFAPGSAHGRPLGMVDLHGRVIFSAFDPATGRELFVSDGTPAGTHLLRDIEPGTAASDPVELTRVGDYVYFVANTVTFGNELWRTDGTAAGTVLVADLFPPNAFGPTGLCACGDRLFFHEYRAQGYGDVYVTDGTAAGTTFVFAQGSNLTCSGNRVFFTGYDLTHGFEPWVTDGVTTQLIEDLIPGFNGNAPAEYTDCGPGVCFRFATANPAEIWFSDGTANGTTLLCTLDPAASPNGLTTSRGRVFFAAWDPSYGDEIFGISTPGASRTLLGDGSAPDHPRLWTRDGGVPVLGSTIDLVGDGPAAHAGFLLAAIATLPAPVPAAPGLIVGGCDWVGLQAGGAVTVATLSATGFSVPFSAPNSAALEGLALQLQAVWFDPGSAPAVQVSNGLQLVLGTAAPH